MRLLAATSVLGRSIARITRSPGRDKYDYSWLISCCAAGTTISNFINPSAGSASTAPDRRWPPNGKTFRGELLYWVAVLSFNTLASSLGDYLARHRGLIGSADGDS